jgi:hypothetical protein
MAETNNIYDIWWWVLKVIASCENLDHVNSAERLIQNFKVMFDDRQLTSKLNAELDNKIEELIWKLDEQTR